MRLLADLVAKRERKGKEMGREKGWWLGLIRQRDDSNSSGTPQIGCSGVPLLQYRSIIKTMEGKFGNLY